ncbi:MAG: site-2 protease family protein, partial [Thermodesulfobacteriota bacterium]|nr:site-2 protease family protein [Thermodesulfobacteriota bacterium]
MFVKRIKIFTLLGFDVYIDLSWIIIAVLIIWSLSKGFFPFYYKGLSSGDYWIMGIAGALGLFLSIIFHELSHSLVSRRYGIPMKGITLFIFGGVAEMSDEPPSAQAEFMMAIAGPISSIIIGLVFWGLSSFAAGWYKPASIVFQYVFYINILLAVFNLIPAFPLDGGRVLRSILWGLKQNLRWATRISSTIGIAFGVFLIIVGVIHILNGSFISGMWWALIGIFLHGAAKNAYQQLITRRALEGERVKRFMKKDPVVISPSLSVHTLVEEYIYKYHYKMFPIVESERLIGCVSTRQVKEIPKEEWERKTVREIAVQCSSEN